MGFFNFGNDDKKEEAKVVNMPQTSAQQESPYTSNGLCLKKVPVEKSVMSPGESYSSNLCGARSNAIGRLFTTDDLDYILRAYAPDTIDTLDSVIHNQKKISNDINALKKQNQELKEMIESLIKEKDLSNGISR